MLKSHLKRYLLVALGTLALGIGMVGLVVPVLPTTPLLLISAYCYLRSSNSLYRWLIGHRVFGRYLRITWKGEPSPQGEGRGSGHIVVFPAGLHVLYTPLQHAHLGCTDRGSGKRLHPQASG